MLNYAVVNPMPSPSQKDAIDFPSHPASHTRVWVSKAPWRLPSLLVSVGAAGTQPKLCPFKVTQLKYKISQKGRAELEDLSSSALILILAMRILTTLQKLLHRLRKAETHTHTSDFQSSTTDKRAIDGP